jgi:hypothetical protein
MGKPVLAATLLTLMISLGGAASATAEPALLVTSGNRLVSFDTASPGTVSVKPITGIGPGQSVRGVDVRPSTGQVFISAVATGSANNSRISTYTVDPTTASATSVGQTSSPVPGAGDVETGYGFNPLAAIPPGDRIRYVNTSDENSQLDPTGLSATNEADLDPAPVEVVAASYDRNVFGTPATTLFAIDRAGKALVRIGGVDGAPSPNDGFVTAIGPLTPTINSFADAGFDISPSGIAYAALVPMNSARLHTVNLVTGAATEVGLIGDGAFDPFSLAILQAPSAPPATPAPAPAVLQSLSVGPKSFRSAKTRGSVLGKATKKAAVGTTVTYALSIAAPTTFTVERRVKGRKVGKKCRKQTRRNRTRKRCTITKTVKGNFTHGGTAGQNRFKFTGRINGKALRPGSYGLIGKTSSSTKTAAFKIVR